MKQAIFTTLIFIFSFSFVSANGLPDADNDAVSDYDEINIYYTDPNNPDTDGDGYTDFEELVNGYSPYEKTNLKLNESDFDNDGLTDREEYNFGTNPTKADTDRDGFADGDEIKYGYDPNNAEPVKLIKEIIINKQSQELDYMLGGVRIATYPVSSGVGNTTPSGEFTIFNKHERAWSPYGLWMPYWMGVGGSRIGIHELPVWPSGAREGEESLGTPVSHGCIRLGVGAAEELYNWAEVNTKVIIK